MPTGNLPESAAKIVEFSMHIERASYTEEHGMGWRATASDVNADKANDEMTMELYNDFISLINSNVAPPEEYCSEFWKGGMPYVSLSHYPDLNGDAVPGMAKSVWVDGDRFKAKGDFFNTPLGMACYKAVKMDTSGPPHPKGPVRISIAFLDYGHIHKSNGVLFMRNADIDGDYCEECVKEFMNKSGSGKWYIRGHLIHLAMTRVPMNDRTNMEVEKSMTTRKEDALSIVEDEELLKDIEEKAKLVGKSELVIKSEDEEKAEHGKKKDEKMPMHDDEMDEDMTEEEKKKKKEKDAKKSDVVIEEPVVDEVVKTIVEPDTRLDTILSRLSGFDTLPAKVDALTQEITQMKSMVVEPAHPLDTIFAQFRADYDQIRLSSSDVDERLRNVQAPFNKLGNELVEVIRSEVKVVSKAAEISGDTTTDALVKALSSVMSPVAKNLGDMSQKLDMLLSARPVERSSVIPHRIGIQPPVNFAKPVVQLNKAQYSVSEVVAKTI